MRSALLCIPLLTACAGNPASPLQSAWYLQHTSTAAPELEIGVLNRSPHDVKIEEVLLNRAHCEGGPAWTSKDGFVLIPGQVVVLKATKFTLQPGTACGPDALERPAGTFARPCMVPVSVAVRLDKQSRAKLEADYAAHFLGSSQQYLSVDLIGRMPSALPASWEECA